MSDRSDSRSEIDLSRIAWVGPFAIVCSIGAVLVVRAAAVALLRPDPKFTPLGWVFPTLDTAILTTARFVLYDNGAFALQYPSLGQGGYRGEYEDAHGVITFEWEGSSVAGQWGASGALRGDALTVQYNQMMRLDDFEDAVYMRIPRLDALQSS